MFEKLKDLFRKGGPSTDDSPEVAPPEAGDPKDFKLKREEIAPIALGLGGCLATNKIVVDGCPVGYMYRETPINEQDSGWRFFAGDENDEYMADNRNRGVYDVNTIVNYDPAILTFIDSEIGSKFERSDDGDFIQVE